MLHDIALPESWKWENIGDIAERINPGFPSGIHNQENRGVPHLRPMNISRNGELDFSQVKYVEVKDYLPLQKGDVLFNNTNSPELVGKTTYIPKDTNWAYSNHMTRIRLNKAKAFPAWVALVLHFNFINGFFLSNCRHHVNQASISSGFLAEKVFIPLPPLPEQERIVSRIEELFTQLDAGTAALRRVQAELKRYKASVLKAACEGRLVTQESLGKSVEEILLRLNKKILVKDSLKPLPKEWCWIELVEAGEIITGKTPPKKDSNNYGKYIPLVKPPELNDDLILESQDNLSIKGASLARILPTDSVLVSCIGNLGKIGINKIPVTCNQQINAVIFQKDIIDPSFGFYYLQTESVKEWLYKQASATTITIINKSKFSHLPFALPPIAEQHRIVAEIERRISIIKRIERSVDETIMRSRLLRNTILRFSFEGRLT